VPWFAKGKTKNYSDKLKEDDQALKNSMSFLTMPSYVSNIVMIVALFAIGSYLSGRIISFNDANLYTITWENQQAVVFCEFR
jgi:hypothetical protein